MCSQITRALQAFVELCKCSVFLSRILFLRSDTFEKCIFEDFCGFCDEKSMKG